MTNRIACRPLTVLVILITLHAQSQNTLDKAGLTSGTPATAAYSTRLLSSSYAGPALRVLRTSDNSTADIGFTANGDLDTATLKTFVGTSTGQVTIWYDQSGNGLNLTQPTIANQPTLVASGGIINRENNQPFIRFYGSGTTYQSLNLAADMTTVGHVSAVIRLISTSDGFLLSHSTVNYYWHSNPPSYQFNSTYASASVLGGNSWANGIAYTPVTLPWPATLTVEEVEPSTPSTGTTWNNIGSDRNQYHDIGAGGGYGELLIFPSAFTQATHDALRANEKYYFSIVTLPVTWLSFTAHAEADGVHLQWQTASEQNSKDFAVQYSPDGTAWISLATIPAAGNSNTTRTYSYVHTDPPAGNDYYRILQTDLDGNPHYSSINLIKVSSTPPEFILQENPATTGVSRITINTPTTLSLFTIDGKLLSKAHYEPGTVEIPVGNYAKGTYLLAGKKLTLHVLVK